MNHRTSKSEHIRKNKMLRPSHSTLKQVRQKVAQWYKTNLPPLFILRNVKVVSHGYQTYFYTKRNLIPGDGYIQTKADLINSTLRKITPGKSVLELGSAEGYYSLWSGLLGAQKVLGVEQDPQPCKIARRVAKIMGLDNVSFSCSSIFDLPAEAKYDVVLAFAIVHWFPNERERPYFNNYPAIVEWLSQRGRQLLVEYIKEDDHTVSQSWWADSYSDSFIQETRKNFTRENFLSALQSRFENVEFLGKTYETREMYFAS